MSCDDYAFVTDVTLYKDHDNAVVVVPYADLSAGINYDMTNYTRVTADADLVDSTASGDAIQGDSTVQVGGKDVIIVDDSTGEWRIHCKVGLFMGIPNRTSIYFLRITIYDTDHPNGLVLPGSDSTLRVTVIDSP